MYIGHNVPVALILRTICVDMCVCVYVYVCGLRCRIHILCLHGAAALAHEKWFCVLRAQKQTVALWQPSTVLAAGNVFGWRRRL